MDCSPPVSSVHGILQARILEWVAIPFSRGSSWPRDRTCVFWIAGRFFIVWVTNEWKLEPLELKMGALVWKARRELVTLNGVLKDKWELTRGIRKREVPKQQEQHIQKTCSSKKKWAEKKTWVARAEHTEERDWEGGGLVMQSLAVPVRAWSLSQSWGLLTLKMKHFKQRMSHNQILF